MDDRLPRLSYELIEWLDQAVPLPEVPATIYGYVRFDDSAVRKLTFLAGQRYMVDVLIALMNEEKRKAGDDPHDDASAADRAPERFARFLQADGDVHSVSIADFDGMDE